MIRQCTLCGRQSFELLSGPRFSDACVGFKCQKHQYSSLFDSLFSIHYRMSSWLPIL